jgi:tetratricopeptide (TPR) repeat protein
VLLQGWGVFEASLGRLATARALFERGASADPTHQALWQAWGVAEAAAGNVDTARALFQRGVWARPASGNTAMCFQAWACLEAKEGQPGLARQLFRAALRLDPTSVPTWHGWAHMEERLGNDARAAELRVLCLQQRAEEAVGLADTGVSAQQLLRPLLDKVTAWFGDAADGAAADAPVEEDGVDEDDDLLFSFQQAQMSGDGAQVQAGDAARSAAAADPDAAKRKLGAGEGVLGIKGLLKNSDAEAAAAAAKELDAALRKAASDARGDQDVAARVKDLIASLGGAGAAGGMPVMSGFDQQSA